MSRLDNRSATDHHRPVLHPRPPRGYLNDPNGPIVVDGLAHLYFQSRPTTDMAAPVEWGHLTSTDFVHWSLHRPAMAPAPDGPDRDGCWSGNTVLDQGRVRAFYSGLRESEPYQSVLTAVSHDGGYSFGPPTQVVADPSPGEDAIMFRDPFVWRVADGWRMVVGAGYADGRSAMRAYASADLETWTSCGDLASLPYRPGGGPETGEAWECPQVLDLSGREVAVVGTWSESTGINRVLSMIIGSEPPQLSLVDHGPNFYAASALRDSVFGPLLFGWITEGRPPHRWIEASWAGALALPRQVWLGADGSVRSAPVPTVDGLRSGPASNASDATVSGQFEVLVPSAPARISVRFGDKERLDIVLDDETNSLTVDRADASEDPDVDGGAAGAEDAFDPASALPAARIFVDGSVVEVFTSAGRVLTTRVYPTRPPPWLIEASEGCVLYELALEGATSVAAMPTPASPHLRWPVAAG